MRDLDGEPHDTVVGFTGSREPVFHSVETQAEEGRGVSRCRLALLDIRDKKEIRRYERPCSVCWRDIKITHRTRRIARIKQPLVPPVSPLGPLDVRVTSDGLLGLRVDPDQWLVFDPAQPLLLEYATDEAADQWRTLRTTWDTIALINPADLAEAHKVDRSQIALWRRQPGFPTVSAFVGDRPGWYPELRPRIEHWIANRPTPRGRKPRTKPEA